MSDVSVLRAAALAFLCFHALSAQQEGMLPRWQVEELAANLVENAEKARSVVGALRPREWVRDGAPEVYVEQHAALLQELESVKLAALALGRQPERLTYAVDTFLWLDRADALFSSVSAGARRYYNAAVADLLDSARSRNAGAVATVKSYMRDLAAHVEGAMAVAHSEAQRCREEIIAKPPSR